MIWSQQWYAAPWRKQQSLDHAFPSCPTITFAITTLQEYRRIKKSWIKLIRLSSNSTNQLFETWYWDRSTKYLFINIFFFSPIITLSPIPTINLPSCETWEIAPDHHKDTHPHVRLERNIFDIETRRNIFDIELFSHGFWNFAKFWSQLQSPSYLSNEQITQS